MVAQASVEFLTEKCNEFEIVVPGNKDGNQQYLVGLVARYSYSEDLENAHDQGQGCMDEKLL